MSALAAELTLIDLGDQRLNRRARRMLEKLGEKPTVSIPAACGGWGETRGAYRLFDHPEVTAERVVKAFCSLWNAEAVAALLIATWTLRSLVPSIWKAPRTSPSRSVTATATLRYEYDCQAER